MGSQIGDPRVGWAAGGRTGDIQVRGEVGAGVDGGTAGREVECIRLPGFAAHDGSSEKGIGIELETRPRLERDRAGIGAAVEAEEYMVEEDRVGRVGAKSKTRITGDDGVSQSEIASRASQTLAVAIEGEEGQLGARLEEAESAASVFVEQAVTHLEVVHPSHDDTIAATAGHE